VYHYSLDVMWRGARFITIGVPLTIWISLASLGLGLLIGLPLGTVRAWGVRILDGVLRAYVEIFRNTPVLVQIVWFYYALPILTKINLDAFTAGTLALGLNSSAYLSEIVRGGIRTTPSGQSDAAMSLGFSRLGVMRYVVLPQVMRKMLAPFLNQFVFLIKDSALVAYIGVLDVMHRGDIVTVQTARPLEAYTTVALVYFVLCLAASEIVRVIEVRYAVPE
jgi:polar amino acid transport system permease protein